MDTERRRRGRSIRKRGYYYASELTVNIATEDGKHRWTLRVDKVIPTKKPRRAKNRRSYRWWLS